MKTILTSLILLLAAGFSMAQQTGSTTTIARDINVKEFHRLMNEKPGTVLDVRTKGEVDKGAIKGSLNLDFFADNFESEVDKLNRNKPVYVYCASGGRSGETMELMNKKGFKEVYNLDGGYNAWKKSYPDK